MIITNETKIFGSFSTNPGNNGATFFNEAFSKNKLNSVYIPVKCSNTESAIQVMDIMNFQGAAFSRPHKISVMSLLNTIDVIAETIGAVNTVVRENHGLTGYNTDWIGTYKLLKQSSFKHLYIYGKGGFSKAVQYACNKLNIGFTILYRNDVLPTVGMILNASPIAIQQDNVLDARPSTPFGFKLFLEQAKAQYELYTGTTYV